MLLRCCLININIIILRLILHLEYLWPCPGLGLFMSYLYNLFFIFSLIFIVINHITSFKQTYLFLDDIVNEESKKISNSKNSAWGCCLAFAWFFANFSLTLLIKVLLIKKACTSYQKEILIHVLIFAIYNSLIFVNSTTKWYA